MISSYEEYLQFLEADRVSLYRTYSRPKWYGDATWIFQRLLRKCEYIRNCKKSKIWKPYYYILRMHYEELSIRYGFTIPLNVFGPGLSIAHRGTIVVNPHVHIGANCRIHVCVNIGTQLGAVPSIGNNVYIGPGTKIFGGVVIADGIAIGANSVVNKSFLEPNITIAGMPAEKVSNKGSEGLLVKGFQMMSEQR